MASQWPHQYQASQTYGYAGFPQQYAQQSTQQQVPQYPHPTIQQQHTSQQYAAPQGYQHQGGQFQAHYPAQYPPNPNAAYGQPASTQHSCYNCGAPDHWAQDCPEPRREVPAGLYNRQNQPPPYKRQKPNPPVITKYPLPPHLQQSQGSTPQGCAVPYGQPGYSQHPAPQAPPTPMSAHSPSYHQWQQWQQKPHSQQYQNANHQHNSYSPAYPQGSQGNYQQQQPNMPTAPPTPATPHGAYSMNQGSPPAVQGNSASYFHNISHQGTSAYPIQQHFGVSPASAMSPRTSYQQHQNPTINASRATEAAVSQHGSRNSSVSMRSLSATPKPQPVEVAGDPLEDDLDKLNVPDIPTIMNGAFAKLVDRPLPANFVVADALEPFDPPQPENDGRCQSRYTKLDGSSTFLESVRNTRHWEDLKKDPIFLSISNDGKILSLESIGDINKAVNADEDQVLKTPEEDDRNHSAQRTERRSISLDAMGRYEHSWQPGQTGAVDRHFTTSREPISLPSTRSQNKRPRDIEPLASPGATVLLKPVREISLPRPPPPVSQGRQQSPEYTPPPRTRTPSMYELDEMYRAEYDLKTSINSGDDQEVKHDGFTQQSSKHNSRPEKPKDPTYIDPFEPPPPPPKLQRPHSFDGVNDGPLSAGSANGNSNSYSISRGGHLNGNAKPSANGQIASPSQIRSEKANGRKRDYEHRGSSDEDDAPKRRQADDVTPKLKKRQPKVAAAYSRRW